MKKPEILLLNPMPVRAVAEALAERYEVRRYYAQEDPAAVLRQFGPLIRGVVTGGQTGIGRGLMEQLPALEVVAVNGVGTDAVDLGYARSRSIHVTVTAGALTEDVADLAIGLLIAACRGLCAGDRYVRAGHWGQRALPLARRFSGMRVGIVGLGRVGRAVAARAAAFGCPIRYTDLGAIDGVAYAFEPDLKQLARDSDALVLAAAAETAVGIVDAAVLDALGPDGLLVNIARGKLVNEADLVAALEAGRIAGAALDVFADEPNVPAALKEMDQVTLQPHRGSATNETRRVMGDMVLASLAQALAGRRPEHSVTT